MCLSHTFDCDSVVSISCYLHSSFLFLLTRPPHTPSLLPYTTLFRSSRRLNASNLFLSLILHLGNLFLIVQLHFSKLFLILKSGVNHTSRGSISTSTLPSIKLRKCNWTIRKRLPRCKDRKSGSAGMPR